MTGPNVDGTMTGPNVDDTMTGPNVDGTMTGPDVDDTVNSVYPTLWSTHCVQPTHDQVLCLMNTCYNWCVDITHMGKREKKGHAHTHTLIEREREREESGGKECDLPQGCCVKPTQDKHQG